MNFVARFESFIESLMERSFTRATRSHLQPIEIGKRLVRAMESEQSVGMEGVLVPNVYNVFLSPSDYDHFEPMQRSLTRNFESNLGRSARQRRFHMMSKPVVRLQRDPAIPAGSLRVEPHLLDVDTGAEPELQHTSVLPSVTSMQPLPRPSSPTLVLNNQPYAILRSPTRVGRLPDNDIVFDDKRVSRYHAEVLSRNGRWMVRDAGSTNGTAVNGKVIKEAPLKAGDTISLGGLEATWEQ